MSILYDIEYLQTAACCTVLHYGCQRQQRISISDTVFIDRCCRYHGSTLAGRKTAICSILMIRQKVPILIFLPLSCIFFPLQGSRQAEKIWINFGQVKDVQPAEAGCLINFKSGGCLPVNVSYRTVQMQLKRCSRFEQTVSSVMPVQTYQEIIGEQK